MVARDLWPDPSCCIVPTISVSSKDQSHPNLPKRSDAMQGRLRISSLVLVLILLLAACQPVQAPGEAAQSGPQSYVIGVVQPFTGSLGSFGTDFGKGIDLA